MTMIDYVAAIIAVIILITTLFFNDWLPLVALIITLVIVFVIIWKLLEEQPKDVAEELVLAKESGGTFYNYITDHVAHPKTYLFMFKCFDNNTRVVALFDAWFNGYTVEKPKLYNLVFGFDSYYKERVAFYKAGSHGVDITIDNETNDDSLKHDDSYQFTQEEIDKYNKNFWINNIDLNDYKELVADD